MNYVLENENESSRLKLQESISIYKLGHDMSGFKIDLQDVVLDAGCGAGLISHFLRSEYKFKDLYSCDFSELRIKQAEKFLKENGIHQTNFFQCDLGSIPQNDDMFSKIVCRFVYEYLPDPHKVSKEFYRVCKPGGAVRVIDLDGVVVNLQTENRELSQMLNKLQRVALKKYNLDFFAGRKIYSSMLQAGFKDIQCQIRPMYFDREDIKKEKANYEERFTFARNILEDTFGIKAQRFVDLYLDELDNEKNLLFYNNFVVTGWKK